MAWDRQAEVRNTRTIPTEQARDESLDVDGEFICVPPMQPFDRRYQPKPQPAAPELLRPASPYKDIPSLYDMYLQARPRPAALNRFGADVFENGTRDSQMIPMDLPVGPDYVVGPGDGWRSICGAE